MITAQRALDIGLVNHVVPEEHLMEKTLEMAEKISSQGQIALAHAKKAINDGIHLPLHDGCKLEIDAFVSCFETDDQKEGMKAFMEKRKPRFQGT